MIKYIGLAILAGCAVYIGYVVLHVFHHREK